MKGVTTASMTAWGLLAYIEAAHTIDVRMLRFRSMIIFTGLRGTCSITSSRMAASFGIDLLLEPGIVVF